MMRSAGVALVSIVGAVVATACTPPNIAGDAIKPPSTGDAFEGVKCSAVRPQTEPDLMAWDPGSRSNLNRLRREGVVAVRYEAKGCNVELELLSHCIGSGTKYGFSPYSANERKVARNANELYAQLPVGAARFAGSVKGNRALRTDYMMAGQYALPAGSTFKLADLRGPDCARATHVISAVYVGGFAMGAGETRSMEASATIFGAGAGGRSAASFEVLGDEGDAEACKTSQHDAKENERCAVPLRIGLLPLEGAPVAPGPTVPAQTAAAPQPATTPGAPSAGVPEDFGPSNGVRMNFALPDGSEAWSLHAASSTLLCALPCARWVGANSRYYLQRNEVSGSALRVDVPSEFPYGIGTSVVAKPERGSVLGPAITLIASAVVVGVGVVLSVSPPKDQFTTSSGGMGTQNDPVPGIIVTSVGVAGLLAGAAWWVWFRGRSLNIAPETGAPQPATPSNTSSGLKF